MSPRSLALSLALLAPAAWAELYKCPQPDGGISYQQHPCANAEPLALDIPQTRNEIVQGAGPSIEEQLRYFERDTVRASSSSGPRQESATAHQYDAAKCARHRAQEAKWARAARATYRDRDQQRERERMLEYHRTLVERHCRP
ncbi:MAG: hypothetical protein JXM75_03250, partial [Chromatiaceae bacterium]|nr:hypothetical protein [Chromatiaceae bacterium]